MSNVVSRSDPLTSSEITMVENLATLATSGAGQAIAKTGATTFANVSASGGGGTWTASTTPVDSGGTTTVFAVGGSAPSEVNADGIVYPPGTTWTFLAGNITISIGGVGPVSFLFYR